VPAERGTSVEPGSTAELEEALRRIVAAIDALPPRVDAASPAIQVWYAVLQKRLEDVRTDVVRLADITRRGRA